MNIIRFNKLLTLGPRKCTVVFRPLRNCSSLTSRDEIYSESLETSEADHVSHLVDRYCHVGSMQQQVLVIQPFIRYGQLSKKDTNHQLMLEESIALVKTLDWKVVDHITVGLTSFQKKHLFGTGKLKLLEEKVTSDQKITSVFISLYQLTISQRLELEKVFCVPVIDRYNLVLQIFYLHARSRESRLQVALAEIPYMKNRLMIDHEYERGNKHSGSRLGEQYYDTQKFILKKLEGGIRRRIDQIKDQRQKLRTSRKDSEIVTVAVIGYTNCGKTSLIKSLTGDTKMQPRNQLFATLDVTCHGTRLPGSNLNTVFIDTVGFISDIPTPLIASFSATLEDALHADLLLHVADFSHPDIEHQISQVMATLKKLKVDVNNPDRFLSVGNKIDLIETDQWKSIIDRGFMPISAIKGFGLDHLAKKVEKQIITCTDRVNMKIKLRPGSEEWDWMRKNSCVGDVQVVEDSNHNIVNIVITKSKLNKFKSLFLR